MVVVGNTEVQLLVTSVGLPPFIDPFIPVGTKSSYDEENVQAERMGTRCREEIKSPPDTTQKNKQIYQVQLLTTLEEINEMYSRQTLITFV